MLKFSFSDRKVGEKIALLQRAFDTKAFDAPVEKAAWRALAELVILTPKKWFGALRRAWQVKTPAVGVRLVGNLMPDGFTPNKVMLFIENGTGNAGTPTSNGGYIYPKTKRFLFIPLTASAAMNGWSPAMKLGIDYIVRRRVRGITARHIVRDYRPTANRILKEEMTSFIRSVIK